MYAVFLFKGEPELADHWWEPAIFMVMNILLHSVQSQVNDNQCLSDCCSPACRTE